MSINSDIQDQRIPENANCGIKQRLCLKCQKEFKSTWEGMRICPNCNTANRVISRRGSTEGGGNQHRKPSTAIKAD